MRYNSNVIIATIEGESRPKNMNDRLAAEKKTKEAGRLPQGQSLTLRFPVLHYGAVPGFDKDNWGFRVFGDVEEEVCFSWEEFCALPQTEITMDIHCVTAWSKTDTLWGGVSLRALVNRGFVRPKPSASVVVQHCEQEYTTNLPIKTAMGENFLLATHFEGVPLAPEHGYPVRGVCGAIPGRADLDDVYLWKGGKWLRGLEFLAADKPGFWERAGYHNRGNVWQEERFSDTE